MVYVISWVGLYDRLYAIIDQRKPNGAGKNLVGYNPYEYESYISVWVLWLVPVHLIRAKQLLLKQLNSTNFTSSDQNFMNIKSHQLATYTLQDKTIHLN